VVLQVALQRQHEGMAVDDPGLGRMQRRHAGERRLHRARRVGADQLQPLDAVDLALFGDPLDLGGLFRVGRDDQLADLAVRHAVARAERVQLAPALHAVLRALRGGRIIHAGVDHLAVARGHAIADAAGRFRDDHLMAGKRSLTRDREPDHAGADNQDLH
jgi:hypothetical protein